jgi:hypothetical protein
MPLTFDATVAAVPQSGAWQCSAASMAWLLDALGKPTSQDDVVNTLGPDRIDPSVGLHDGSGAGLVAVLSAAYGVSAINGPVSFDDALGLAAAGPCLLGGGAWNHWTGVRGTDGQTLDLANPSPGYRGVGSSLSRAQFDALGPFYAVWPTDVAAGNSNAPASSGPPGWTIIVAGGLAALWALELL